MNPSIKRPRSPSPYFALLSTSHPDQLARSDTNQLPLVRSIEALEAQLCNIESLALQVESRGTQIQDGRLIRLNENYVSKQPMVDSSLEQAWVDRYDARLLLSPPPFSSTNSNLEPQIITPPPLSPTGFSDLPSDHEEMFYFKPNERLEIAQKKLRRRRDDERSFRIRLREEEDKQREEDLRLSKIPPSEQINLMTRTLEALKSSPSPSLLEIRILANHGNDPRFSSFLKKDGKWSSYWESMKANQSQQVQNPELSLSDESLGNTCSNSNIGPPAGLVDYDDSNSEKEDEMDETYHQPTPIASASPAHDTSKLFEPSDSKNPSTLNHKPSDLSPSNLKSNTIVNELHPAESDVKSPSDQILLYSELFFETDSTPATSTENTVNSAEQLNRQQRAKLWAEKRRKLNSTNPTASP